MAAVGGPSAETPQGTSRPGPGNDDEVVKNLLGELSLDDTPSPASFVGTAASTPPSAGAIPAAAVGGQSSCPPQPGEAAAYDSLGAPFLAAAALRQHAEAAVEEARVLQVVARAGEPQQGR